MHVLTHHCSTKIMKSAIPLNRLSFASVKLKMHFTRFIRRVYQHYEGKTADHLDPWGACNSNSICD